MVPRAEVDWIAQELRRQGEIAESDRRFLRDQTAKFMGQLTTNTLALAVGIILMLVTKSCQLSGDGHDIIFRRSTPTSGGSQSKRSRSTTSPSFHQLGP